MRCVGLGVQEGEVEIVNRVVTIGPNGKMTFELRLKKGGSWPCGHLEEKYSRQKEQPIPNHMVEVCLVCARKSKAASVAGVWC